MSEPRLAGPGAGRGPGRRSRAAAARTRGEAHRRDRGILEAGRGHDRHGHDRQRGVVGGGAARGRRCGPRRRAAARRRGRRRLLRNPAARATTPSAGRRWASACSTTSRLPPAHAIATGRRRAGADLRLGRAPRQRNRGDLLRGPVGPLLEHPPEPALPRHRRGRRRRARRGGGLHGQPARAAGLRFGRVPVAHPARGRARRPRASTRGSSSSRPATTPTATTRWRSARSTRAASRRWRRAFASSAPSSGCRMVVCLEGGYNVTALAASVVATIDGLGGSEPPEPAAEGPAAPYRRALAKHWPL